MPETNQITIKNAIVIICIMLIGLYVALGAIFSLSYIKDTPADKDAIVAQFDTAFQKPLSRFQTDFEQMENQTNDFKEIQQQIVQIRGFLLNDFVRKAPQPVSARVEATLNEVVDSLTRHANNLSIQGELVYKQYQDCVTTLNNIKERGNGRFLSAINRLSSGLLAQYSQKLIGFFGDYEAIASTTLHHNLSDFRRNAALLDRIAKIANTNIDLLHSKLENKDSLVQLKAETIITLHFLPTVTSYSLTQIDSVSVATLVFPEEGQIGQDWGGVFQLLIGPIARSKNVDVLLLCGMIGFGLFGASIAVFITGTNLAKDTAGSNIFLVIVRGFSAAIVVYLAGRAGIAVVNNGASDPNPLVLFLFCFVGAVFSERIWAWAKIKISDSFPEKPGVGP